MTPMERVVYGGQLVTTSWESLRLRCWGSRCLYSLYCLEGVFSETQFFCQLGSRQLGT